MVNLFELVAEPIVVDHKQLDYPIVPDSRSRNKHRIQRVVRVLDITDEVPKTVPPLYGLKHNQSRESCFWLYKTPEPEIEEISRLEIVCPNLNPEQNQTRVLSPTLICNNDDMVLELPANPRLECLDNIALPSKPVLLSRATAPVYHPKTITTRLDLLTHLNQNFVSILQVGNASEAMQGLLSLYSFHNSPVSKGWIESLLDLYPVAVVAPVRIGGYQCFTQGNEVHIELDPARLKNISIMMFINLLDFLAAGYAGVQSFIQLVVKLKGEPGEYIRCIRRHGYQINR